MHGGVVCSLKNITPLGGTDFLVTAQALGYTIILNKNTEGIDSPGIFFDSELQLSEEFATTHDLVRRKNPDGSRAGGFFEENRRVRAIRLKGSKSEGFWMPLSCLEYAGNVSSLKSGDVIAVFNGHPICDKYVTPETRRAARRAKKLAKFKCPGFPEHVYTEQLKRSLDCIRPGDLITLTEKIHGTSHRVTLTRPLLPRKKGGFFTELWAKITKKPDVTIGDWTIVNGTRRVVLNPELVDKDNPGYRLIHTIGKNFHRNEVVFGEIVGWDGDRPIQPSVKVVDDKQLKKVYGDTITYSYGIPKGESKFVVYRIIQVNPDKEGHYVELSYKAMCLRAEELGYSTVPFIEQFIYDGDQDYLVERVMKHVEDGSGFPIPSLLCPAHIREGVVVRVDGERTKYFKAKSTVFLIMEGHQKDMPEFVDPEEVQSV